MPSERLEIQRLAFIGGTGPEGRGLALRFASIGHEVIIGSRSPERAEEIAGELRTTLGGGSIRGAANEDAASAGDIVLVTIPYRGAADTLPPLVDALARKVVVSTIAPVEFQEGRPVALRVEAGSAAQEVQAILARSRVVSAFQNADSHQLQDLEAALDADVVVCSDDADARHEVVELAGRLPGVRALSGGRLASSRYVEEITALLITINRIYKTHSGIRITGVNR